MKRLALLLLLLLIVPRPGVARVSSLKESKFGVLLRGKGGTSGVGKSPYGDSSGTDTSIDDETKYSYGGELGAVIGFNNFNLRIGAEVIQHHPVSEGHGNNAAGNERFKLESSTFVFNPNITAEIFMENTDHFRFSALVGVGYAMADVSNRYTMTSTGTTELGVSDFSEKMSGTGMSYLLGVNLEAPMLDNVTISLEGGYQYIRLSQIKYTGDVNNIVSPTGAAKGDAALKNDGSKRELNLSNAYVGASLRFYLHFL